MKQTLSLILYFQLERRFWKLEWATAAAAIFRSQIVIDSRSRQCRKWFRKLARDVVGKPWHAPIRHWKVSPGLSAIIMRFLRARYVCNTLSSQPIEHRMRCTKRMHKVRFSGRMGPMAHACTRKLETEKWNHINICVPREIMSGESYYLRRCFGRCVDERFDEQFRQ